MKWFHCACEGPGSHLHAYARSVTLEHPSVWHLMERGSSGDVGMCEMLLYSLARIFSAVQIPGKRESLIGTKRQSNSCSKWESLIGTKQQSNSQKKQQVKERTKVRQIAPWATSLDSKHWLHFSFRRFWGWFDHFSEYWAIVKHFPAQEVD